MAVIHVCDSDGKTVITGDPVEYGFGIKRVYCRAVEADMDAYVEAVKAGAAKAREVFRAEREEARKVLLAKYPDAKLPDEGDVSRTISDPVFGEASDEEVSEALTDSQIGGIVREMEAALKDGKKDFYEAKFEMLAGQDIHVWQTVDGLRWSRV